MVEPGEYEFAAFISKGDAGILVEALALYLMQSDVPTYRREQAGEMQEQFFRMSESGER